MWMPSLRYDLSEGLTLISFLQVGAGLNDCASDKEKVYRLRRQKTVASLGTGLQIMTQKYPEKPHRNIWPTHSDCVRTNISCFMALSLGLACYVEIDNQYGLWYLAMQCCPRKELSIWRGLETKSYVKARSTGRNSQCSWDNGKTML